MRIIKPGRKLLRQIFKCRRCECVFEAQNSREMSIDQLYEFGMPSDHYISVSAFCPCCKVECTKPVTADKLFGDYMEMEGNGHGESEGVRSNSGSGRRK